MTTEQRVAVLESTVLHLQMENKNLAGFAEMQAQQVDALRQEVRDCRQLIGVLRGRFDSHQDPAPYSARYATTDTKGWMVG